MGDRIINLLHLILMVVEPFYFYWVSLDEVKCLVDYNNSTNSGYIDIYILHLALLIIISICFYNQLRLVRLLRSGLFPVVFEIALLFFSTVVVLFGSLYYVFAIKEKLNSCNLVGYNNHGYYIDVSKHGFHRRHTSLVQRSYFCFQWGLQNLIYLGKNLKSTDNTSQDLLVLLIVFSGVFFGVLLLGSLKTYYDLLRNPDGVHGGGMVVPGPDSPEEDDKAL